MNYQFAQVSKVVEEKLRRMLEQRTCAEICVPGAIRLMLSGSAMPFAVFLSEEEIDDLEENGYDRYHDPCMLHNAVVLVMESASNGQLNKRRIYEQGDLLEMRR